MMSDENTGGAASTGTQTPANDLARFDKFFATEAQAAPVEQMQEATPGEVVADAGKEEVSSEPRPSTLAEKIRIDRETRLARQKEHVDQSSFKDRAERAEERLARITGKDFVEDPAGWADEMGLTKEERVIMAETMLYSLAPEKADADVKIRLLEARQARAKKLAEQKATEERAKAEEARAIQVHEEYVAALEASAMQLPAGSHPDTEAWFGDDHQAYVRSLYHTANNMAELAKKENKVADLSFGAVAAELERELNKRYERRAKREVIPVVKQETKVKTEVAEKATPVPGGLSTRGLGGGSTPRPPATTEAERIARASEVAFRTK